ncbi:MAG: hypothetical protein WA899_14805 [Candidatus Sulfotelmatobacter sp.]
MLAEIGQKVPAGTDVVQREHDGVCRQHGLLDLECRLAGKIGLGKIGLGFRAAHAGLGNRRVSCRTDRSGRGIIKLAEGTAMRRVWLSIVQLSFPYYVLSAGMTSMVNTVSHHLGWQAALVVFPVMYGIHRSYRLYFRHEEETPRTVPLARAARAGA